MPTQSKPVELLKFEGKSHRTKEELDFREEQEKATLTGKKMQAFPQVKDDPVAKKEFYRMRNLLKKIDKDDALYQGPVNRLAMLHSECIRFEESKSNALGDLGRIEAALDDGDIDFTTYMDSTAKVRSNVIQLDKQIQTKRNMMLAIEKETLMTVAAALRAIPKKPPAKPKDDNEDMFD